MPGTVNASRPHFRLAPAHSDRDATLSLGDALILAVTERLGCMVLTRDGYWKWMVDEGHLKVQVAIP